MLEKPSINISSVERCFQNSPHNYYKVWLIHGSDFGITGYKTRTDPDIHTMPLTWVTFSESTGRQKKIKSLDQTHKVLLAGRLKTKSMSSRYDKNTHIMIKMRLCLQT